MCLNILSKEQFTPFFESTFWQHICSLGLKTVDIPALSGIALSQNTEKWTWLIVIMFGSLLNGRVLIVALHLSFITLILCLISATCSDAAVVLMVTCGISGITLLNFMSIIIVWTLKPAQEYKVIISFRLDANCFMVWVGMNSAASNPIQYPNMTTKGKLSMNITSAVRVTNLFILIRLHGIWT